jgi:hypothetical protein
MRFKKSLITVASVMTLAAGTANAQERSGWITAQAGMTSAGPSAWTIAGEAGRRLTSTVSIYGSFGRLADVTPGALRQSVQTAARQGLNLSVAAPTLFGIAGVRVNAPGGGVRPYGLLGFGFASVTPRFEMSGVDVTSDIESSLGMSLDGRGRIVELGGGVEMGGPLLLDLGYRLMRLGDGHNVSRVHAAIGVGF